MKKKYFIGLLLALLVSYFPIVVQASTINFDDIAANPTQSISNDYLSLGVIFTNALVVHEGNWGNGSVSSPNAVMIGSTPTCLTFHMPGSYTPGITDFVSAYVGDWSIETDEIQMTAYDFDNVILDSATYTTTNVFGLISISAEGIHRVEFIELIGSGADFDNLTFNSITSVPIPGALFLLGSGLLGIVGLRRRI